MNFSDLDASNYLKEFEKILNHMTRKMLNFKKKDNITLTFIECMIPHHQAAIYMCENLLKYTKNYPLRQIGQNIIFLQRRGIKQMREIAKTTVGYASSTLEENEYINGYVQIANHMIRRMQNSPRSRNINWDFVNEMIPHHEGAIAMCNHLLQYRIDPRLRKVAYSIIQEQSRGVEELKNIRRILLYNRKGT